jgi:thioredoxin-like negative regulator of GroEL
MKQIIYFTAGWCPSCQRTNPIVEQAISSGLKIAKIDVDYDATYVSKFNVKSVPTAIVLENGNEVKRHVGAFTSSQLNNLING